MYIPGTIKQTMHWCWNATYSNAVVRNWLFQQVNEKPAF
jgi:predicted peptidase